MIIGVDVGGTLIRAARFDEHLEMRQRVEQPTNAHQGEKAVLGYLYETIRQVLPSESPGDLEGIGLALPGPLDLDAGVLIAPPNLPFKNTPICQLVEDQVARPVYLVNDADAAGLAEHRLGAGVGMRSLIYLTISTGIGGGLILDGRLYTGRGQGGEIGHMVVDPNGPLCNCGRPGHLEALASGTAIARTARARVEAGEETLIADLVDGDFDQITARTVGQAAGEGDRLALSVINDAGRYIGMAIASLMMVLNPDIVVLGGGVSRMGSLLLDPVQQAVRQYAMHPRYWENTPIVTARLGKDVGLYGAAVMVQQRIGEAGS